MSTKKHCDSCDKQTDWIADFKYSAKIPTIGASINDGGTLELCLSCMDSVNYFLRRIKKETK